MKRVFIFLLWFCALPVHAASHELNVYNWANYLPNSVIKEFEKETGIHVNYATYDNNETLYAKLRADPHAGYDIIVPSSYYIDRMRNAGILQKLDKSKLPNFKYINPALLHLRFDPNNDYTIPYLWSATGIVVNTRYINLKDVQNWSDFWQPQYKDRLLMLDDMHEVFSVALLVLGYSTSDKNPEHIKQAYQKLLQLLPNIKLFNADATQNIYVDEDVRIGMIWSGDFYRASSENKYLQFIYPQDGFSYSIDNIAVPKYAPHLENAYKFINFIMRPDIAKQISLGVGYPSPNLGAIKLMSKDLQDNVVLNPPASILKRGHLQRDTGAAEEIYEHYWELLKIGGD